MNKQRIKQVVAKQPYWMFISDEDIRQVEDSVTEVQYPAYFDDHSWFATTYVKRVNNQWIETTVWKKEAEPEEWNKKDHSRVYPSTEEFIRDIRRSYSVIGQEAVIVLKDTSSFMLKRVRKYTRK